VKRYVKSNKPWFKGYAEKDGWCYGVLLSENKKTKEVDVKIRSDLISTSLKTDWKVVALKNVPDIL
jgi:hypothetical protein